MCERMRRCLNVSAHPSIAKDRKVARTLLQYGYGKDSRARHVHSGIKVKLSRILHPDSRLGFVTSGTILKSSVVQYYYGFLDHENLSKKRHRAKMYEKTVMLVTTETFRK